MMLANMTSAQELVLAEFEAKMLAENIAEVQQYYPLFQASDKAQAWFNLIVCLGGVYGTRIVAIRARMATRPVAPPRPTAEPPRPANTAPPSPGNGAQRVHVPGANIEVEIPPGGWPA